MTTTTTEASEKLVRITETIVQAMVETPKDVKVKAMHSEQRCVLTINVNPQDLSLILGRGGRTVDALRIVLMPITSRLGIRFFDLDVVRP